VSYYLLKTIILLLVTFMSGCSVTQVVFDRVDGKIVDSRTKDPLGDALVFIHWQSEKSTNVNVYGSDPLHVDEVLTDRYGGFSFPVSKSIKLKSGTGLRYYTPTISVLKKGYGFKVVDLFHSGNKQYINTTIYSNRSGSKEIINLNEVALKDVVLNSQHSDTSTFFQNLDYLTRNENCFVGNLPKTLNFLKKFVNEAEKAGKNLIYKMRLTSISSRLDKALDRYNSCAPGG